MKYILSEQEYRELKSLKKQAITLSKDKLQTLCTKIANEMPIKFWGNDVPEIWGCELSEHQSSSGYCDECPVQEICPNEHKEWSK